MGKSLNQKVSFERWSQHQPSKIHEAVQQGSNWAGVTPPQLYSTVCAPHCQELHSEPDRHGSCTHITCNLSREFYNLSTDKQATSIWQGKYFHKESKPGPVKMYTGAFTVKCERETDCNKQRNIEKQKEESHIGRVLWGHLRGAVNPVLYKSFLEEVTENWDLNKHEFAARVLYWRTHD